MSVDVLQPKFSPGPNFNYPHFPRSHMKENRGTQVETRPHRNTEDSNSKTNVNHFDPNCIIYDSTSDTTYLRGRLLGKGGFARCYELLNLNTNKVYAGKIVSKTRIAKPHQKQKIIREVDLQRNLKHRNVVEFHSFFEDDEFVYLVLENCSRKSLVHMLKHRKMLTEIEVRYYMRQLVEGIKYIHSHNIIHRDLKLGNMLLNENMELKIADFGLATKIGYEGEKKMTVCGTPNYIAPEVLQKRGHSYEADVWALGCVMYALLVGRPPFETSTLKETYVRITGNSYVLPNTISGPAKNLIQKCLTPEPELRPSLDQFLIDDFFTSGYMPQTLPSSCCNAVPKFPVYTKFNRPKSYAVPDKQDPIERVTSPFRKVEITARSDKSDKTSEGSDRGSPAAFPPIKSPIRELVSERSNRSDRSDSPPQRDLSPKPRTAANLLDVLHTCLEHMPKDVTSNPVAVGDFTITWVTKWVDYSNKYGFGFQLSNDAIGVLFNDTSRIVMSPDGRAIQYFDMTGKLSTFTVDCVPEELEKKTTLLLYFARYMDEHLIQGGNVETSRDSDDYVWGGTAYLKKWFRTGKAIVLYLSDGTLQVNFFDDHTKIIMSYMKNDYFVTYIDEDRTASTYPMVHIIQDGCRRDIVERMAFAKSMLKNLVDIEGADI
ncbi:serine/threonine-protein kinase PLK1-like [Pecten maximus]|uniref:serine/threonine-protein kinase PLK1-like n=1 Tax=Pecten maximus TaxID=6579 RepID=UPI0014586635|nr:serine/threonine-protein kinase PLK1-like [Pecten maximus]XP_033737470.1 serine/threonine-protein kinase PLK1-like [Pecten maximus]XP_033737471.1 serine/threonine-protein kinase PLK1-like [Pecten maximus]